MGIRGLKTFISNNSDLLERHELHDTYVVIDGNNLLYCLYWRSSTQSKDHIYGGDYCRFATTTTQFFKLLENCKINPIVVLDGGIDPSLIKFKTIKQRYQKQLEEVKRLSKYNMTNEKVIPSLAKQVFVSMMRDMNVDHIQASYEADSCIARIANRLKCPVLSNDSDFYVFDLNAGVIPIDSIDNSWTVKSVFDQISGDLKYKFIDCDLYKIDNLIEYFPGLQREILPLFSTLMGNDYVESYVFDNIFSVIPNVCSNTRNKSKGLHVGKRHSRMIKLLNWLRNRSVDETVQFLINFLKKNDRNKALDLLKLSLESYAEGNCDSDIFNNDFETQFDGNCVAILSSFMLKTNNSLPKWFNDEFQKSLLSTKFMNIIEMKCDFLSPRIEDFSLLSSYTCTLELRKFIYGLLRWNDESKPITVYDRVKTQFSNFQIEPYLKAPNNQILPNLHNLRDLNLNERKLLLFDILSVNEELLENLKNLFLCSDPEITAKHNDIDGAVFLIVVIKYWISNCQNKIWIEFIYSLLTNMIFCGHIGSYTKIKFILFSKLSIKETVEILSEFTSRPKHNCAKIFQPRIVHYFNEFQNCLQHIKYLYSLFDFPSGQPFYFLSGTFIYNLTVELSSRKDPVLYLSEKFGRNSFTTNIFMKLLELVFDGVDQNKFVRCQEVSNRKSHKESQKLKNKKSEKNKNPTLENRFNSLALESI